MFFENGVDAVGLIKINGTTQKIKRFLLTVPRCSNLFPKPLSLPYNLRIIVTALDGLERVPTGPMVIVRGSHVELALTD